jgi:hypothetical protein
MTELIIERVDAGPAFDQFRVLFTECAVISHNRGCSKDPEGEFYRASRAVCRARWCICGICSAVATRIAEHL